MSVSSEQQSKSIRTEALTSRITERAWSFLGVTMLFGVLAGTTTACGTPQPYDCRTEAVNEASHPDHIIGFRATITGQYEADQTFVNATITTTNVETEQKTEHTSSYVKDPDATIYLVPIGTSIGDKGVATLHVKQGKDDADPTNCAPLSYTQQIPFASIPGLPTA